MSTMADARYESMNEDPDYQRLLRKHDRYDRRLAELRSRKYLTQDEQMEEVRLKKLKLSLKDQMAALLRRASAS